MAKHNARRILADPFPAIAEIEDAIAWLKRDIAYVERIHSFPSKDMQDSIEESRSLLQQLQDKLNSQSR